jgi:hypothetical protein
MEVVMSDLSDAKVCDFGNLILGALLIFCSWKFGFAAEPQSANALLTGIVLAAVSTAALTTFAVWEEWLNLVVGLWLIVSPWVLDFQSIEAVRIEYTIGVVVAAFAWNELWFRSHPKPEARLQPRPEGSATRQVDAAEHNPKVMA